MAPQLKPPTPSEWVVVRSLPKVSAAKLHFENRCWIHPIGDYGKGRFEMSKGWRLVGWSTPPYLSGGGKDAIVYE
jgi:hypothetical protein